MELVGIDDTPVWMVYKDPETGKYGPILVGWYNVGTYEEKHFLSLRTFGTEKEAKLFLKDFWQAYWRLSL